jgi:hypothetical protein
MATFSGSFYLAVSNPVPNRPPAAAAFTSGVVDWLAFRHGLPLQLCAALG